MPHFFRDVITDGLSVMEQGVSTTRVSPRELWPNHPCPRGLQVNSPAQIAEGDSDNIILVTYEFEGPEANVKKANYRSCTHIHGRIYPVFAESCYLVSASIVNLACP